MPDDPTKPPMHHAPGEGEHPEGVPPEFHEHFMRSMRHHGYPEHYSEIEERFGHHKGHEGHEGHEHRHEGAPPGGIPGAKPAEYSGSNEIRGKNQDAQKRAMWAKDPINPDNDTYQRQGQPNAYAALRAEMLAKNQAIERQLAQERYQRQRSDCERLADQLEYEGYLFNRERFIRDAIPMDERGRLALCKETQQYSRQDPAAVSQRFIPSAGGGKGLQPFNADPERELAKETDDLDRRLELAETYQRDHEGKSWSEAMAWAREQSAKR